MLLVTGRTTLIDFGRTPALLSPALVQDVEIGQEVALPQKQPGLLARNEAPLQRN